MKRMFKKYSLFLMIGLIAFTGYSSFTFAETVYPNPGDPSPPQVIEGEVKWVSGIIMDDIHSGHPTTVAAVKALIKSEGKPGRTGFSAEWFVCKNYDLAGERNPVQWIQRNVHQTTNQLDRPDASEYMDQIVAIYGESYRGALGELEVMDYYSVYHEDTRFLPCVDGQESYFYNDNEIVLGGYLSLPVDDPGGSHERPGTGEGDARGGAFWELQRNNVDTASDVYTRSAFEIAGVHYATRNALHKVNFAGRSISQEGPITETAGGPSVKGANYSYSFEYEYTNFYKDIYTCTNSKGGDCFTWTFVERIPDWEESQQFILADTINIDHRIHDTVKRDTLEGVQKSKTFKFVWVTPTSIQL